MFFKRRALVILIFCLTLFALVLLFMKSPQQKSANQQSAVSQQQSPALEPAPIAVPKVNKTQSASAKAAVPQESFNEKLALALLQQIALDEQGRPMVDNHLKRQLDDAVNLIGNERSPAELEKINQLIRKTFALATAETVEHILQRYYSYKIAEQDYAITLGETESINAVKNEQTLSAMRESYMGQELAEQLFGEEKRYSNYVSELTEKLSAPDLSEEMRRNITAELQKKYHQESEEPEDLVPREDI